MQQLGIPFELRLIDVLGGEQKSDGYLQINPNGVVPFMLAEDGQGLGESNAMAWYLAENSPLMPQSPLHRAQALQWLFFEQSKLEPFLSPARFFTTILPAERAARAADIAAWQTQAAPGLQHLDQHLAERQFMIDCGYSVADIGMFGYVHVLDEAGLSWGDYPNIAAWKARVEETDDFQPLSALGQMTPHNASAAA